MNFLESIKKIFQEKTIHINISLVQKENENGTRLLKAINNIENHMACFISSLHFGTDGFSLAYYFSGLKSNANELTN